MKPKIPFSKFIVVLVTILSTGFIGWSCYEMHRLNDLSPIAYIGAGIVALLATVVGTYMWRAKQQDKFKIAMNRITIVAELQKKYPDMDLSGLLADSDNSGFYYGGYESNIEGL